MESGWRFWSSQVVFGGKSYLARKFVEMMPPHLHYVEPFFGGGTVLLAHSGENRSELVSDKHKHLTNLWRVLQVPKLFEEFLRIEQATPLSRYEWEWARDHLEHENPAIAAHAFFVFCRQSRAGQMTSFTSPTRTRLRRGMNGNVSEWLSAVDGLPDVHARLRRVMIENLDALTLIPREDTPDTLFYCDPPYLHETRTGGDEYQHEMNADQHRQLLSLLVELKGKFMLSGYESPLYNSVATACGWKCHRFDIANNAAGGGEKRRMVECLWTNF